MLPYFHNIRLLIISPILELRAGQIHGGDMRCRYWGFRATGGWEYVMFAGLEMNSPLNMSSTHSTPNSLCILTSLIAGSALQHHARQRNNPLYHFYPQSSVQLTLRVQVALRHIGSSLRPATAAAEKCGISQAITTAPTCILAGTAYNMGKEVKKQI
ncbi:hypothetical protein GQ43DRAFT_39089 [Delitschia confertaspora ATCC 74209]|uniref:Uncharacterized protein n=1 Tax=Delitschia confertaspora ATCC 74209 TaxID=1513339 RepID=A0A9P4JNC4_9PLEO|nr:hypothetical protein GQ43DRAFT_39089 [Delitschia confertaspora ATCC 74209]